MPMNSLMRRKYLEECASNCPFCEATARVGPIRRLVDTATVKLAPDAPPAIVVGCYCPCGAEWTERYRLEAVS